MMETGDENNALVEWVYTEYSQLIWCIALAYVGETDAYDVVQEIMLRLVERPKILSGLSPMEMRAFVVKATKNYCIDILRHCETKATSYELVLEYLGDTWQSHEGDPMERVEEDELIALLMRTLKKLTPENRIVVEQRLRYQLSSQEIADSLHLNKKTVEKRMNRGRKELRRVMQGVGYHV